MALSAGAAISAGTTARAQERFFMPPEWHPHDACFMAFSAALAQYGSDLTEEVRAEQAKIAKAIARFEPVTMLVNPEDMQDAVRLVGDAATFREIRHYDIWARDSLPTFVIKDETSCAAISWNFNIWGEKFPGDPGYDADRDLAERFAADLDIELIIAGIVAEGGAIETDGEGTLLTTETCLLNDNRNPGLGKDEVTAELLALTGTEQVIWLPGSEEDYITDGHIDGIARFIKPGLVVAEVTDDRQDPEYAALEENVLALEAATDARGRNLEVIRILRPRWEHMLDHGEYFAASYVNYYLANQGLVMAEFGDVERDQAARELFARLHPGFEIVQLSIDAISEGGGGIHCNTQQLPSLVSQREQSAP